MSKHAKPTTGAERCHIVHRDLRGTDLGTETCYNFGAFPRHSDGVALGGVGSSVGVESSRIEVEQNRLDEMSCYFIGTGTVERLNSY